MLYDKPHFRITPWPAEGIPLPARLEAHSVDLISSGDDVRLVAPFRDWVTGTGRNARPLNLVPGQLYLRVANTDLDDPDAVENLIAQVGPLGLNRYAGGGFGSPFAGHLDYFDDYEDEVAEDELEHGREFVPDDMERRWMALGDLGVSDETLEQFLAAAGLVKDAVTVKRLLLDGDLDVPPWQMLDVYAYNYPIWDNDTYGLQDGRLDPLDVDCAAALTRLLDQTVSSAVGGFSPRLFDRVTGVPDRFADLWSFVPLYSIMMAELFNHIVLEAPTRRCANPRCNQLFVHQDGRAQKGTNRSRGVLYHSASCARAVAQRAYRERKRRNS